MGQRLSTCLHRHRKKLFVFGGIVGGVTLLNIYMRHKFLEWERKRTTEYMEQMKKQRHFDGAMQICDSALLSFMPKVREIIVDAIRVEPVVEELKGRPSYKRELWDELKIMVFTQLVAEVYAQCLLVILLRVQISIVSGCIYADFQKNKNNGEQKASENQQKYLTHISSFLVGGIKDLLIPVEDAVRRSLRGVKLSDMVKVDDFHRIYQNIKESVSQGVVENITQYLMLPDHKDSNQNESSCDSYLERIVAETKDVLECDDFAKVLNCCLEKGVAMLMDRTYECYMHINSGENFLNPHTLSAPLAKVIPIMHTVFQNHKPSEQGSLVHTLLQEDTPLKTFAANLYEAFCQDAI